MKFKDERIISANESSIDQEKDQEIYAELEQYLERSNDFWKCKKCGKIAKQKQKLKIHVETHIQGVSHICKICGKGFATRASLATHIHGIHSLQYSCDICLRKNMNRKQVSKHTYRCNGTPLVQRNAV